jgi:hypothetical protein
MRFLLIVVARRPPGIPAPPQARVAPRAGRGSWRPARRCWLADRVDLTAKLQIKRGQTIAAVGIPDGLDRLAWIACPKAGKLGTDLNRDILAALVADRGVRPVRQVAIDETWSALRFRPA